MAYFKCIQSGNILEFTQEHEIAEMRKHGGYAEVVPETPVVEEPAAPIKTSSKKAVKTNEISIDG